MLVSKQERPASYLDPTSQSHAATDPINNMASEPLEHTSLPQTTERAAVSLSVATTGIENNLSIQPSAQSVKLD